MKRNMTVPDNGSDEEILSGNESEGADIEDDDDIDIDHNSESEDNLDAYDSLVENDTDDSSDDNDVVDDDEDEDNDDDEDDDGDDDDDDDDDNDEDDDEEQPQNNDSDEMDDQQPQKKSKKRTKSSSSDKSVPPSKKSKSSSSNLKKPPTLDEINQLNETQNLFHSNLFRFQIDEMLKEVKITKKYIQRIENWVKLFNDNLKSFKLKDKIYTFDEARENLKEKFNIEFPLDMKMFDNLKTKQPTFQFAKVGSCKIIGSCRQNTLIGPQLEIDLCIEMPKEMFVWKANESHLNGNYHQKRALYLMFIASKLTKNSDIFNEIKFSYYGNDLLNPILVISPIGDKLENRVKFLLQVTCEEESFKITRFLPATNNVREKRGENLDAEDTKPTPFYNSTILQNLLSIRNNDFIDDTIQTQQNMRDAIKLIKIWTKQRGLDNKCMGMNGFIISMIVCYLIQNKKVSSTMSSYQIVRIFWNFVGHSEWNQKGISLWKPPFQPMPPATDEFHQFFELVFTDQSGFFNILYAMNIDIYYRIKKECLNAIEILNDLKNNSFRCLFMTKMPFYQQFDHIITIKDEFNNEIDLNENKYSKIFKKILSPLRKGLGDRILSITPFLTLSNDQTWNLDGTPMYKTKLINFGLILNPDEAFNILIKGPAANDTESQEFRDFWGEHSTLRRFRDGSITEAVVLCANDASLSEKRLITKKITEIIFKKYLPSIKYNYIANQIDNALENESDKTCEDIALEVIKTFDEIGKKIRLMDNLPLEVTAFQGISSIFRYSDPMPSRAVSTIENKIFLSTKIYCGKLQLVQSGKWPNDLEAIKRLKSAFYIKIAQNLRENNFAKCKPHHSGIDVLKDGHVFRFSVTHPKEIALKKREINEIVTKYVSTKESIEMEKESMMLTKLTSYLHGLYLKNPAIGPTMCLAKRWLYSHYLDSVLFPDECTELLIAYLFLKSKPFYQPNQPQTGFFRFLSFLSETDFLNEMIVVNFNDEITDDQISEIEKKFVSARSIFPSLCILTPCDMGNLSIFSKSGPNEQVLTRVVLLARHCIGLIEQNLLNEKFKFKTLFMDSFVGYDLLIKLNARSNVRTPAGLDYVECYLSELREAYNEVALFFRNPLCTDSIAVLFRPDYFHDKEFKTSLVNGRKLNLTNNKLQPNLAALISDFEFIGKGLVNRVEKLKNFTMK